MMITYVFDQDILASPAQTIVNTVNCVGVMGKGLALACKQAYGPAYFAAYQQDCREYRLQVGQPTLYKHSDTRWLLNFPTKKDWRNPSQLGYLMPGLAHVEATYESLGITSIAFPKLGCGNGGLLWRVVGPLMADFLDELPIPVMIYLQKGDAPYHSHMHE